jgi:hypothetical protein
MTGWHISVCRQAGDRGLEWLREVAVELPGDGYPSAFTARAADLRPFLLAGPPEARAAWSHGAGDTLTEKWAGKTVVDREALASRAPGEWLLVIAWDES